MSMTRIAALIAIAIAIAMAELVVPAQAKKITFEPGQWGISGPSKQQICIVSDGTWYGTTYNWSGHWSYTPDKQAFSVAAIFGNYAINNMPFGYGNDTMTIFYLHGQLAVSWQDWFDDESYAYFSGFVMVKIKTKCDAPYTGNNTQAPSQ